MVIAAKPMMATTVKKKPTQRVAMNTLLRASLALGTVKKRIRIWGRPAVPNIRPSDRDCLLYTSRCV